LKWDPSTPNYDPVSAGYGTESKTKEVIKEDVRDGEASLKLSLPSWSQEGFGRDKPNARVFFIEEYTSFNFIYQNNHISINDVFALSKICAMALLR